MIIKGKKINFLGDSITEGVGVSSIDKVYWKLLEKNDGCDVWADGIGGTRIAKQMAIDESVFVRKYFASRVPDMRPEADIVVVFGGTNDYGHGDAPFGEFSDRDVDTFYGAYHTLCIDLMKKYPKAQLVIMTPCHRLNEERYLNDHGIRNVGTLKDYVEAIKEVAEYYGIPVVDLYKNSGMQPEIESNREIYMPDGLHPSDAGHELIYSRLKGLLESL